MKINQSLRSRFAHHQDGFRRRPLEEITLHASAGSSLQGAIEWLLRQGFNYHFIIDRDGEVYQLISFYNRGRHNVATNDSGIGICLVGNGTYTLEQVSTLGRLVKNDRRLKNLEVRKHKDSRATLCPVGVPRTFIDFLNEL